MSSCSFLAVRAPVSGALSLGEVPDEMAADSARLSVAFVDVELLTEIAGVAVGAHVVAQRGAADLHGHREGRLHRARESRAFDASQRPRLPSGAHAGAKERLRRIAVADADHQAGVHERELD